MSRLPHSVAGWRRAALLIALVCASRVTVGATRLHRAPHGLPGSRYGDGHTDNSAIAEAVAASSGGKATTRGLLAHASKLAKPDFSYYMRKDDLLAHVREIVASRPDIMRMEDVSTRDGEYAVSLQLITVDFTGFAASAESTVTPATDAALNNTAEATTEATAGGSAGVGGSGGITLEDAAAGRLLFESLLSGNADGGVIGSSRGDGSHVFGQDALADALSAAGAVRSAMSVAPGADASRARLLLDFGEHGREFVSSELGVRLLRALASPDALLAALHGDAARAARMAALLRRCVLKILPMENPNGRSAVEAGRLCERKNGRGVDPNRNWAVDWGKKEKDYDPAEEFPGTRPFSEPEVQVLLHTASAWSPHVWLNVHSGMEAMFTPYDHKDSVPPAAQAALGLLQQIHADLKMTNSCVVGSGGKSVGYLAHGTATDYMFEVVKVPMPYTWEIYGDFKADYHDCFRMFNPITKESLDSVLALWLEAIFRLIELLPTHPATAFLAEDGPVAAASSVSSSSVSGTADVEGGDASGSRSASRGSNSGGVAGAATAQIDSGVPSTEKSRITVDRGELPVVQKVTAASHVSHPHVDSDPAAAAVAAAQRPQQQQLTAEQAAAAAAAAAIAAVNGAATAAIGGADGAASAVASSNGRLEATTTTTSTAAAGGTGPIVVLVKGTLVVHHTQWLQAVVGCLSLVIVATVAIRYLRSSAVWDAEHASGGVQHSYSPNSTSGGGRSSNGGSPGGGNRLNGGYTSAADVDAGGGVAVQGGLDLRTRSINSPTKGLPLYSRVSAASAITVDGSLGSARGNTVSRFSSSGL